MVVLLFQGAPAERPLPILHVIVDLNNRCSSVASKNADLYQSTGGFELKEAFSYNRGKTKDSELIILRNLVSVADADLLIVSPGDVGGDVDEFRVATTFKSSMIAFVQRRANIYSHSGGIQFYVAFKPEGAPEAQRVGFFRQEKKLQKRYVFAPAGTSSARNRVSNAPVCHNFAIIRQLIPSG